MEHPTFELVNQALPCFISKDSSQVEKVIMDINEKQHCRRCGSTQLRHVSGDDVYECQVCYSIMVPSKKTQNFRPLSTGAGNTPLKGNKVTKPRKIREDTVELDTPSSDVYGIAYQPRNSRSQGTSLVFEEPGAYGICRIHAEGNSLEGSVVLRWYDNGMKQDEFLIQNRFVLRNLITALEKIRADFDEDFEYTGSEQETDFSPVAVQNITRCLFCGEKLDKRSRQGFVIYCGSCSEAHFVDKRTGAIIIGTGPRHEIDMALYTTGQFEILDKLTKRAINPDIQTRVVKGLTIACVPPDHQAILVVSNGRTKERAVGFYHWQYDGVTGRWLLNACGKVKNVSNIDALVSMLKSV